MEEWPIRYTLTGTSRSRFMEENTEVQPRADRTLKGASFPRGHAAFSRTPPHRPTRWGHTDCDLGQFADLFCTSVPSAKWDGQSPFLGGCCEDAMFWCVQSRAQGLTQTRCSRNVSGCHQARETPRGEVAGPRRGWVWTPWGQLPVWAPSCAL